MPLKMTPGRYVISHERETIEGGVIRDGSALMRDGVNERPFRRRDPVVRPQKKKKMVPR